MSARIASGAAGALTGGIFVHESVRLGRAAFLRDRSAGEGTGGTDRDFPLLPS